MEFRYMNTEVERSRNAVIETLREKEHHYKNILEAMPFGIYTCDVHGYITFFNKAAAMLWGREPQAGKDVWTGSWKVYNANGERLMPEASAMAISINEGNVVNGEETIIERPDGTRNNVLSHPHLFFDDDGKVTGAMNILIEVTDPVSNKS